MAKNRRRIALIVVLVAVVIGGVFWMIGLRISIGFAVSDSEDQRTIDTQREEIAVLRARLTNVMKGVAVFMTPRHMEAVLLMFAQKEICAEISLIELLWAEDTHCLEVIRPEFPTWEDRLRMLMHLEVVIASARAFVLARCELFEDAKPRICLEVAEFPTSAVRPERREK